MAQITTAANGRKYIIKNRLDYPEALNERELNAIAGGMFPNLAPVSLDKSKKEVVLKCTFENMIPLQEYYSGVVNRQMFLNLLRCLLPVIRECEKNYMQANNIYLDMNCIMVEPQSGSMTFIYWPVMNSVTAVNPAVFLSDLPYRVVFDNTEDNQYILNYIDFFQSGEPFSAVALQSLMLSGDSWDQTPPPPPRMVACRYCGQKNPENAVVCMYCGQSMEDGTVSGGSSPVSRQELCPHCGRDNPQGAAFCVHCGQSMQTQQTPAEDLCPYCGQGNPQGSAFCIRCGQSMQAQTSPDLQDSCPHCGQGNPKGTNNCMYCGKPMREVASAQPSFPYLIREKTGERVSVDKPSFRIGKERQYCDYFVSDNSAVSRSHADILTKGNRYFIVDNNSTNKTYVNFRAIPILTEVEIFDGTKLRLANEDFTFHI